MNQDSFEEQLRRQSLRPMPKEWKEEILLQARQANRSPHPSTQLRETNQPTFLPQLKTKLREWFWPHPVAWGGLAALWLIILSLNFITPQSKSFHHQARLKMTDPAQTEMAAAEHSNLRKEMLDFSMIHRSTKSQPKQTTPPTDGPRSHLQSTQLMT